VRKLVVNNNYLNNINKVTGSQISQQKTNRSQANGNFESILQDKIKQNEQLKFSKHAELRLQTRNIKLTEVQKEKINEAVNKAEGKGVKDSLVILDNLAFVVNVKSRTVITAVNSGDLKENVFTNIDGAVFA
jgi:flagellar operon protein